MVEFTSGWTAGGLPPDAIEGMVDELILDPTVSDPEQADRLAEVVF